MIVIWEFRYFMLASEDLDYSRIQPLLLLFDTMRRDTILVMTVGERSGKQSQHFNYYDRQLASISNCASFR